MVLMVMDLESMRRLCEKDFALWLRMRLHMTKAREKLWANVGRRSARFTSTISTTYIYMVGGNSGKDCEMVGGWREFDGSCHKGYLSAKRISHRPQIMAIEKPKKKNI